jgi:heptosyltransferase III
VLSFFILTPEFRLLNSDFFLFSGLLMNLLLARTGGLGDCILTLPVVSRLREMHPDARFHILGNAAMLEVASLAGGWDGMRSIDDAGFAQLYSGDEPTPFLRDYFSRFDGVWFFTAADPELIVRNVLASGACACRVLGPRPPRGFHGYIVNHLLSILGSPLLSPPALPPVSFIDHPARIPGRLLIHPGSGSLSKTWPIERFLAVAEWWSGDVVFLLGPAEEERGTGACIPDTWEILRGLSISETARALASTRRFLGCDSGVSHLAALCRAPSVVLFGPSDPAVWRPLGEKTTVVVSADGTMGGIGVDEVLGALVKIRG